MRTPLILLALSTIAISRAQAPGVELSEPFTFPDEEYVGGEILIADGAPHLYTYARPKTHALKGGNKLRQSEYLAVERYDPATLTRVGGFVYDDFDAKREHYSLTSLGERFVWTYVTESAANAKKGRSGKKPEPTYSLRADVLDAGGKRVAQHRLGKIRVKEFGDARRFEARSPDGRYLVQVVSNEAPRRLLSKSKLTGYVNIAVVDAEGALVSAEKHRFPGKRDQLQVESVAVDDQGGAYVIARVYRNQKASERADRASGGVVPYSLKNVYLPAGAESAVTSNVATNRAFVQGLAHYNRPGGGLGLVGVYSDRATASGRAGSTILGVVTADRADTSARLRKQPFGEGDYANMGDRASKRGLFNRDEAEGLKHVYYMRGGVETADGVSVLLEGYQRIERQSNNGGRSVTDYYYDGLVLDLDAAGELVRANNVPKRQVVPIATQLPGVVGFAIAVAASGTGTSAKDRYYASTCALSLGDRLGVLYNDNPKNLARDEERKAKKTNWAGATAILAYFDEDGALVRKPLFSRRVDKLLLHTNSSRVGPGGRVYVLASRMRALSDNEVVLARLLPGEGGALEGLEDF